MTNGMERTKMMTLKMPGTKVIPKKIVRSRPVTIQNLPRRNLRKGWKKK